MTDYLLAPTSRDILAELWVCWPFHRLDKCMHQTGHCVCFLAIQKPGQTMFLRLLEHYPAVCLYIDSCAEQLHHIQ